MAGPSLSPAYAYVIYKDGAKAVVAANLIRDFHATSVNDRVKNVEVYWRDVEAATEDDGEGYYQASIEEMGISKEDLAKRLNKRRIRWPSVVLENDTSDAATSSQKETHLLSVQESLLPLENDDQVKFSTKEDQWAGYFSKYTNNTYRSEDSLIVQQNVLSLIVELLKAKSVGQKGLQYLIAWSVYRQLMKYTLSHLLVGRRTKSDACYEHAEKAMRVAVTSPYYQTVVPPDTLEAVKTMLLNIRTAYADTFKNSSWVQGEDRIIAVQKLSKMRSYVGSLGRYLDPAYVEELYKSFPDVPRDRLFPSWIKAMSLSSHHKWADQTSHIFDETDVNAHYEPDINLIVIPTAIITRPFYYSEGPPALNYGGLGMVSPFKLYPKDLESRAY
ncbi:hypothetical protein MTO96_029769 [Rhipicephalus appendiculatus]